MAALIIPLREPSRMYVRGGTTKRRTHPVRLCQSEEISRRLFAV